MIRTTGSEFSVSVDASASVDFGPASVSVDVDVTTTSSESETYSTEQSNSQTFDVPGIEPRRVVRCMDTRGQAEHRQRGHNPLTDPNYTFDPHSPSDNVDSTGRSYVDIPWGQPHGKTYFF